MSDAGTAGPHLAELGSAPAGDDLRLQLAAHPFAEDFDAPHLDALAPLLGRVVLDADTFVFRHGQPAETLYLLTDGAVALEIAGPGREPLVLETLHEGDALGWSWLYPPHRWHLDARVVAPTTALTVDAVGLRRLFVDDPVLGVVVTWRVGALVVDRLHHAREQLASVHLP
jgi:CRP/FNR family cyclic AMP-dependent transcriptional regulator